MPTPMRSPSKEDLPPVPYFFRSTYLEGDFESGTIETEQGKRLVLLPQELIVGLHQALRFETGTAWNVVAYTCGRKWGARFLRNMQDEWRSYYSMPFDHVEYYIFDAWLVQYFSFLGWGELEIDFSREEEGMVQFYLEHSVLDRLLEDLESDYVNEIFAGLIAATCSWLSHRELECLEIESVRTGASRSRMIVGLPERVERARRARLNGAKTGEMIEAFLDDPK